MKRKHLITFLILATLPQLTRAEDEGGEPRIGEGKAITAADQKNGIRLSEEARKSLGMAVAPIQGTGTFRIPLNALVSFQGEQGVYRQKDGWIKLIDVTLVSQSATEAVVKSSELLNGDQIVVQGVALVRVAELEAWGGSGEGHGH